MIKFLRRNQQVFILFIFLYSIVAVFSVYFLYPGSVYRVAPFRLPFLTDLTTHWESMTHTELLVALISGISLVFSAFYLVRINISHMILSRRSQFPAIFFVAISAFIFRYELFSPAVFALIFLLLAIDRILGTLQSQKLTYRFLDAGILIGIGSIFYINLIFFVPFLWMSQITLRSFSFREFSYTLLGLALPFLYIFSGYFFLDRPIHTTFDEVAGWLVMKRVFDYSLPFYYSVGYYLLIMLLAQFYALNKFASSKVQVRKIYQVWFYLFINAILIFALVPAAGIEMLYFIAAPVAVLLAIYFSDCQNSFMNRVLFILLIFSPLVINIFL